MQLEPLLSSPGSGLEKPSASMTDCSARCEDEPQSPCSVGPYCEPSQVSDLADCYFYHTMDVPGVGTVSGEWDLRGGVDAYLGRYDFAGKRVLDIGAANGALSFYAESQGGEVVSFDLSERQSWDIVPFARGASATASQRAQHIRRLNNAYWLCHQAFRSRAKMAYGEVYNIPRSIGPVDVAIFGSILLHLRDPFLALQNGASLARRAVIVTEVCPLNRFGALLNSPKFLPDYRRPDRWDTWWALPPRLIQRQLAVLGFEKSTITWHKQIFRGKRRLLYTIVARR